MSTAPRVAVFGIGKMGSAMVERLLKCGEESVVVWNRTHERALIASSKATHAAQRGRVMVAATPDHAVHALNESDAASKLLLVVVSNARVGENLLKRLDRVIDSSHTIVNLVSGSPDSGREMRAAIPNAQFYLDGAYCGAPNSVRDGSGQLFLSAASEEEVHSARDILQGLGDLTFAGPIGASRALDYAVVDLAFVNFASFCANAPMLDQEGVDWNLFTKAAAKRLEAVPESISSRFETMRKDDPDYHGNPVATLATWRNFFASRFSYLKNHKLPEHAMAQFAVDILDKAGASHLKYQGADLARIQEVLRFDKCISPDIPDDPSPSPPPRDDDEKDK
mmetsp:Transcript_17735/g.26630  ORF Transcript_17735/g.26630 Transcript_17735/m.26630 type:complete len:337 (+) Transcript_17735:68-1078(+)|eukprot:CAMPEP_0197307346 /NCGR_PEP_ID=MMETSP0891-20130614/4968_1 /TAXON_ID=44058 ORGANISM="Aureoumbra lagunensis, Strain CCMP1510" /NCGR_SAMPLE_ID=MMETSP0891 /ASSEMBLY_ACC=CAM_ASM_000534 /LENGTH=336 /DNA_ID=CAMNT_0042790597 /DNA_START=9 /DNA_END=1019 /DNA_ORIENTATION=-